MTGTGLGLPKDATQNDILPPDPGGVSRITEAGNTRITEAGNIRIIELIP